MAKCDHCKTHAEKRYAWTLQACANKRRRNQFWLCAACDMDLNRMVLHFFNHKKAEKLASAYEKKMQKEAPPR